MMYLGAGIGLSQGPLGGWALALGVAAALSNPLVMAVRLVNQRRHGAEAVAHPYFLGLEIEDFYLSNRPVRVDRAVRLVLRRLRLRRPRLPGVAGVGAGAPARIDMMRHARGLTVEPGCATSSGRFQAGSTERADE
jgi:hypothetical protein